MHRYYKMLEHWDNFGPPVYISVAGYLGWKPQRKKKASDNQVGNLEDLMSQFEGGAI